MKLQNKTAIVTGAERGIGREIALRLAAEGAHVIVNFYHKAEAGEGVVRDIEANGGRAKCVWADVSDPKGREALIEASLAHTGRLDILVNNAGVEVHEFVVDACPETWDRTMNTNLRGPFFLSVLASQWMRRQGAGKIICITSVHEIRPLRERAIYSMSKAALSMMVKSLALELGPLNIQVNAIAPGAVLTDMNRSHLEEASKRERLVARIPAGRMGDPTDIAGAAVFLASPDSDYVHGTTIYVDGGLLLT